MSLRRMLGAHPAISALVLIAVTAPVFVMGFSSAALWVDQSRIRRIASFEDETRRRTAIEFQELGRIRSQRLRQVAADMLNSSDPDVRLQAIYALAALSGAEFRKQVESRLLEDEDSVVRFTAAFFVLQIGGPASIPVLCDALEDRSRLVRWAAARALGYTRLGDAFPLVAWHLSNDDPDRPLLLQLATQASTGPLDIPYWARMLKSPVASDRRIACMALALTNARFLDDDVAALLDDAEPAVRAAACVSLGLMGSRMYLPHLTHLVNDPDIRVRSNAVRTLGMLKADDALKICSSVLRTPPRPFRPPERKNRIPRFIFRTKEGLVRKLPFKIEGSMFIPPVLLDWPGIEERDVRFSAIVGVLGIQDASTVPLLVSLLHDRDPRVAEAAVLGIQGHNTEQVFDHMSQIILDSERSVESRKIAAKWLSESAPQRGLPVLLRAYDTVTITLNDDPDSDDFLREVIVQIGRFRSDRSLEVLEKAVRYPNPNVRSAGVRALGSLASREAIDVLEDVYEHDHDRSVSDAAMRELTRLRAVMERDHLRN